jgi:hypothetical protein
MIPKYVGVLTLTLDVKNVVQQNIRGHNKL